MFSYKQTRGHIYKSKVPLSQKNKVFKKYLAVYDAIELHNKSSQYEFFVSFEPTVSPYVSITIPYKSGGVLKYYIEYIDQVHRLTGVMIEQLRLIGDIR